MNERQIEQRLYLPFYERIRKFLFKFFKVEYNEYI